jgi:hypothetical protein
MLTMLPEILVPYRRFIQGCKAEAGRGYVIMLYPGFFNEYQSSHEIRALTLDDCCVSLATVIRCECSACN